MREPATFSNVNILLFSDLRNRSASFISQEHQSVDAATLLQCDQRAR